MLAKTHLAIGAAFMLFFLPHVTYKLVFVPVVLIAALLPDIDSMYSTFGHHWFFRPFQFFVKHRGFIHSLTVCFAFSLLFAFYIPAIALPFFLGYSSHLVGDSFTPEGVRLFWPFKGVSSGKLRTGGITEKGVFYVFLLVNAILFFMLFV